MIAITFALATESCDLVGQLTEKHVRDGSELVFGKIDKQPVAIFHTGVGRKSCESKINGFLRSEQPDFLISSGFAGGVREDLHAGDLFLAENFSERQLLDRARQTLIDRNPKIGRLFTSTAIIDSIAERHETARTNGAAAVDMETEFVATACEARGIPMLSLRVISDSTSEPLPAPPGVLFDIERQRTDFKKLIAHSIGHPAAAWRLIVFARQIRNARARLTDALAALLHPL